jgi:hypothetical protein
MNSVRSTNKSWAFHLALDSLTRFETLKRVFPAERSEATEVD